MRSSFLKGLAMTALLGASLAPGLPAGVKIVAHRGASQDAPENTLAAFRLAWSQGADAIEGDFRLTKDGRIVCLHDETTKRTANLDCAVADSTFAQLRQLDFGSWKDSRWAREQIPSIEEVLATVPKGKQIFIEIKSGPELVVPLKQALASSSLTPRQVIIISFQSQVITEAKRQLPGIKAFWLTGYKQDKESGVWTPSLPDILRTLNSIRADGLDTQAHDLVDAPFAQTVRKAGFELHVWTVDDPLVARRCVRLGARSITTNRPGWLREQLRTTRD
jgi:glycerophosphoryl diester phosphodiesterase